MFMFPFPRLVNILVPLREAQNISLMILMMMMMMTMVMIIMMIIDVVMVMM